MRSCDQLSSIQRDIPRKKRERRSVNVGLSLGQRRRRWPSSKPTLVQRLVFVGLA